MSKRKICVVTGSRAEYGLLYWLLKEIEVDKQLDLQLIVTGMHLSPEFGLTYKEIEKDFKIDKKINLSLTADNSQGISNSMSIAQRSFSKTYDELKPDIILVLGDRYEIFSSVIAAMIARIPVAHIHGGEVTKGAIDEAIRHCITKMSHIHFVATKEYFKRLVQLGENKKNIFNVGGMGIENIKRLKLLSRKEFEKSINFKLNKKNILVTFHPITLEKKESKIHFQELLKCIDELKDTNIIFTKANSDMGGKVINKMIDQYINKNRQKSIGVASLGQVRYLSALQYVDVVVGNSSSGLLEAPSFKIGTINIGNRQSGRIKANSVVDCLPSKKSIRIAFKKVYSKKFQNNLKNVKNPYGEGCASIKITKVLKNIKLKSILKKDFFNIKFSI